jgi:MscS family membrane protein
VVGVILMLRLLGANFTAIATTTGGAAIIAGLAMRDTLSNILGGLALLIDTPFRFGDLVVWEGVVCQIKRIGLRVTTFYNTEDHAEVYIPNSLLAASKLINLTRPSPDLRVPIPVTFSDGQKAASARDTLCDAADANPYILGDVSRKIDAMDRALKAAAPGSLAERELKWGLTALRREHLLDRRLKREIVLVNHILTVIRSAEKGGFKPEEHQLIEEQLTELAEHDAQLKSAIVSWARARARDPHLRGYPEERQRLVEEAEMRVQALDDQMAHVRHHLESRNLYDMQRLDDMVARFGEWLPWSFKHITPAWKYPFVSIRQANASPLPVQLIVYVDDIHLEGFLRRQRAISALSEAITERLRQP